jgi:hypothetical protein
MSGQALSAYCGFLNEYYEFLATGQYEVAENIANKMDTFWLKLTEVERKTAEQHAHQLAEKYSS